MYCMSAAGMNDNTSLMPNGMSLYAVYIMRVYIRSVSYKLNVRTLLDN